jgi:gamma-glutamyltranspeptidase/glutathione hydrolase
MALKTLREIDTEYIEPIRVKIPQPQRISVSHSGMVSTAHYLATQAGVRCLQSGGNALDAAAAAAFALGVVEPQASGLGGQTMMLVYLAEQDRLFALDGSSRAPCRALGENFKLKAPRLYGFSAATVPSTPAVLGYALASYGTRTLEEILAPAIELAEEGYPVTQLQTKLQRRELKNFAKGNAGQIFLKNGIRPFSTGQIMLQPALAKTLLRLSKMGIEDFYQGQIAQTIHNDMQANGGLIQKDDLAQIPYPIEREPVSGRLGNLMVYTMPPPGAGRTLIEMIHIIKKFPTTDRNPDTPVGAILLAETIRRAQLDRRDRPYDPNFFPQVQDEHMISNDYAKLVSQQIRTRIKTSGETTHLSVMDKKGNVVSLTQSIERVYGSKVMTPDLGFLYNNYMSAFEYEDITHPYYMRPNGIPWASVAPTIILRNKKPWMAIGSPGSERIASAILQVLLRLKYQSPFDAVAAPRIHCSHNGKVSLEAAYMRDDIPSELLARGFDVEVREPMSFYLGCIQMVLRQGEDYIGVADPRRDGSAAGPKA